jgi:hypothetical protein
MMLCSDCLAVIRRPSLVGVAFLLRSVVSLELAWSGSRLLAPSWVMAQRTGDRELWAPGATILLRVIAEQEQGFVRLLRVDALIGLGLIVLGGIAAAIVLCGLVDEPKARPSHWIGRGIRRSPQIVLITVAGWLLMATALVVAKLAAPVIPTFVYPTIGEIGADCALLLLSIVTLFTVFLTVIVSDLARALATREDFGLLAAFAGATQCLSNERTRCIAGAAAFTLPAICAPLVLEWWLPSTTSASAFGLVVRVLVHQLMILGLCILHLGWWQRALSLVQVRGERCEPIPV